MVLVTECVAELRQVRPVAERCETAEGRVQQVESEAEALREMVANLTEGKVALTTKVSRNTCPLSGSGHDNFP